MRRRTISDIIGAALIASGLLVLASNPFPAISAKPGLSWLGAQPASAQSLRRSADALRTVYQQVPNLPLENQYINRETGEANPESTLIERLVRYHIYVKGRPINYRLDWKLTLADYLGANERINPTTYPGADSLRENPLQGDIAAIGRLNQAQRNQLVQVLVNLFASASASSTQPGVSSSQPTRSPSSGPSTANTRPTAPAPVNNRPGAADLLLP